MATEVTCIVDTDGTQSPDYTSLAAAIAGETGASPKCVTSADLVTNDEQLTIECRATSGAADTTPVTIRGFTTDADNYVKISVPAAHRHQGAWDDNKAVFAPVTTSYGMQYMDSFVYLEGLQIDCVGYGNYCNVGIRWNSPGIVVDSCIIRNSCTGSRGSPIGIQPYNVSTTDKCYIRNCLIYGFRVTGNSYTQAGIDVHYSDVAVYNTVISGCIVGGNAGNGTLTFRNCALFDNDDDFLGDPIVTYTASDDNDISGTGNVDISPGATEADDWAAAFTDYANGDFSLVSGSPLIDAGTDLSAVMDSVDIIGTSRPQGDYWDIGAFEYVVSGGTLSIPVAMHHYNLLRSA